MWFWACPAPVRVIPDLLTVKALRLLQSAATGSTRTPILECAAKSCRTSHACRNGRSELSCTENQMLYILRRTEY